MNNFIDELKKLREEKGISLEVISRKTRVNIKFLEKIENGDLKFLPYPYIISFVKSYAEYLGIDNVEDVISELKEMTIEQESEEKGDIDSENVIIDEPKKMDIKKKIMIYLSVIFVLFIVVIISIGSFVFEQRKSEIKVLDESTFDINFEGKISPQGRALSLKRIQGESFKIDVIAKEETWLSIKFDGNEVNEYTLKPTEKIVIHAYDSVVMRIGKSQGIDLFLNGKNLGILGPPKTLVWEMVITSKGIQKKQLKIRTDLDESSVGNKDTTGSVN